MPFNPKSEYTIVPTEISIKDFYEYEEDFVTRPPYQRKAVWSRKKKQSLVDSLFRRYYVPKLVIRELLCRYHNQSKGAKMSSDS